MARNAKLTIVEAEEIVYVILSLIIPERAG